MSIKLVYIAGYGRSGSTYLDELLSSFKGVRGFGELNELFIQYDNSSARCSCGKNYHECDLWGGFPVNAVSMKKVNEESESIFSLFKSKNVEYTDNTELFKYVLSKDPSVEYIVDSSKTCWLTSLRPYRLSQNGVQVHIIHLVRPLNDVIKSVKGGTNKYLMYGGREKKFKVTRCILSWLYANAMAYINKWLIGKECKYVFVDQRELRDKPEAVVSRVFSEFEMGSAEKNTDNIQLHVAGGNRNKFHD